MIDALDLILKKMFTDAMVEVLDESGTRTPALGSTDFKVTFGPPDGTQRPTGATSIINIYLVDIYENRKLRRNDRVTLGEGRKAVEAQSPLRLDCHYLVSAWGAANAVEEEQVRHVHQLLYAASAAMLRHNPLIPREVFRVPETLDSEVDARVARDPHGTLPDFLTDDFKDFYTLDPILRDMEIPVDPLPPEGFHKIAEFWGLMGTDPRWWPVAYLVATIPVERTRRVRGPDVRSIGTTYLPPERDDVVEPRGETYFTIGGIVQRIEQDTDSQKDKVVPVPFASVQLSYTRAEEKVPHVVERIERVTADRDGRYVFDRVTAGPVQIEATVPVRIAAQSPETRPHTIVLPGNSSLPPTHVPPTRVGEYDFTFPRVVPGP